MNSNTRVHLLIDGRVQGVCFRYYCQDEAKRLGIWGWVKNFPDGRVEVTAEGNQQAILAFVKWCHQGPPSAYVAECAETYAEPTGEFDSFEIRF